jgi:hypothetical protein
MDLKNFQLAQKLGELTEEFILNLHIVHVTRQGVDMTDLPSTQ